MRIGLKLALSRVNPERRIAICWPEPDAVCLEGGCGYCRDNSRHSKAIKVIAKWAEERGLAEEFAYGLSHKWFIPGEVEAK